MLRRRLVTCAVAVTLLAAIAALRWNRIPTVSATASQAALVFEGVTAIGGGPPAPGCPTGSFFTFCDQAPGTTGAGAQFTVLATVQVKGVAVALAPIPGLSADFASADFTITNNTCSGTINANATCSLDVAFSPTTTGFRPAELNVSDSSGDMLVIKIAGTGSNLALAPPASPPVCGGGSAVQENAFTYCNQVVGTASGAQTFIVSSGVAVNNVKVSLAAIPGLSSEFASGDFTSTNNCGSLGAGGNCSASVEFTPTVAGLRSAELTATAIDASNSMISYTTTVYVAGTGTTSPTTPPVLQFTAPTVTPSATCPSISGYDFCNEPHGGTSYTNTFTIQNTSGTQITGLTITPAVPTSPPTQPPPPASDFSPLSTTCAPTLAASASCTINVAFAPQGTGLRQGEVTVTDAEGDVAGINLAGVGDDYEMALASSQPTEITVKQGDTATFMAQVTADNVFGANGEMVQFACPTTLPAFSTCSFNPCPVSMTPGMSVSFNIVIVTSSKIKQAPPVTNPCMASASNARANRAPRLATMYVMPKASRGGSDDGGGARFPALAAIGIGLLVGAFTLVPFGRDFARKLLSITARVRNAKRDPSTPCADRVRNMQMAETSAHFAQDDGAWGSGSCAGTPLRMTAVVALAGIVALIFVGCHKSSAPIDVTPTGVYSLTITGNALDANGNALNASRSLSFTLDVIQGP